MPEVIEVRKYSDFLNKKMKNKYIEKINILQGRYKTHGPFQLYNEIIKELPLKVIEIKTKGKFLYFLLENGYYIFSTLGLRGGWAFRSNLKDRFIFPTLIDNLGNYDIKKYKKNAKNHLNIEFVIESGSIYFFDTLSFGTMKIVDNIEELNKKLKSLAPDIMDLETTFEIFKNQIIKKVNLEKPIGNVIMNQKVISGIGNYLRADILWLSRISPFRLVKDINDKELKLIYKNTRLLTWGDYSYTKAIKFKIIETNDKLPIHYNRNFFVYDQKKDIFGNEVTKEELFEGSQKRTIYWVKNLQK